MAEQVSVGGKIDETGYARPWYATFSEGAAMHLAETAWKVAQRAAGANMSVDVKQGTGFIDISSSYGYWAWVASSDKNVTVDASDPSNPRIDRLVAYIDLASITTASTNNTGALKFMSVAGTPAGSPSAPSNATVQAAIGAGNPFIDLAQIAVAAGATSISTANITDKRPALALHTPLKRTITSLSATTVLSWGYDVASVDASGGARTITLPDATLQAGGTLVIRKNDTSSNVVTVATTGAQTIEGLSTFPLVKEGSLVEVMSDGTNWKVQRMVKSPFKFRVYRNTAANQTFLANTNTKVDMDAKQYDYLNAFSLANDLFTAPVDGDYHFDWAMQTVGATIGANHVDWSFLQKNASGEAARSAVVHQVTGYVYSSGGSADLTLEAGDTIGLWGICNVAAGVGGAADGSITWFSGHLVV